MIDLYESFYGLARDPFRLGADHTFAYAHKSYKAALTYLKFAAYREEGFVMITGKPGTGKTTLIAEILSELNPEKVITATLVTTQLESHDLLKMIAAAFDVDYVDANKSTLLLRIETFLRRNHEAQRRAILLVDEAQGLTLDAIEELRQLSNMVVDGNPMLQTFLIGQDELRTLVKSPQLDQLRQRIVASSHLEPLTESEVFGYVRHRLTLAGWNDDPQIANAVVKLVHHYSNGIPRKVNLIFGRLLLHGFTEEKHTLLREDMEAVVQELKKELLIFDEDTAPSDVYGPDACTGFLEPDAAVSETPEETDSQPRGDTGSVTDVSPIDQDIELLDDDLSTEEPASGEDIPGFEDETADPGRDNSNTESLMVGQPQPEGKKVSYRGALLLLFVLVLLLADGKYQFHKILLSPGPEHKVVSSPVVTEKNKQALPVEPAENIDQDSMTKQDVHPAYPK